jgi:hypothetical protein
VFLLSVKNMWSGCLEKMDPRRISHVVKEGEVTGRAVNKAD